MFVTEIFKSIQGEGTRAGLPCIFVRLTGCNLRCTWCDTAYAFHGGTKMGVEEVLARVDELAGRSGDGGGSPAKVPLVELTGGEPLLQEEIYALAEKLIGKIQDRMNTLRVDARAASFDAPIGVRSTTQIYW